jgi:NAD(P)-dependent dehydrogenase (short-subunit alcohol dehydrogenase family)
MGSLVGKVAVVTGASRGIGKGIALALGAEGATVYVTGRTVTAGSYPLPGTVGETAAEVDRRGGKGVAVKVDHANDDEVAVLFEQIRLEQGRLDILVNNAFSLPEDLTEPQPFWEKPLSNWEMIDVGVRSSFVAAWHAAKIMVPQKSGLMVAISGYVGVTYTYGVIFGTCKSAVDRMARDMAIELQPHNVVSLSLWQGLTFTERAYRNLERNPAMKKLTVTNPAIGCTPEHPGRVIAALVNDSDVMKRSGGTFITAEVALDYGITDVDGKIIPSLRAERGSPIWRPILPHPVQPRHGSLRSGAVPLGLSPRCHHRSGRFCWRAETSLRLGLSPAPAGSGGDASQSPQPDLRDRRRHRPYRNLLPLCRPQPRRDQLDRRRPLHRPAGTPRRGVANRIANECHRMVRGGPDHAAAFR